MNRRLRISGHGYRWNRHKVHGWRKGAQHVCHCSWCEGNLGVYFRSREKDAARREIVEQLDGRKA